MENLKLDAKLSLQEPAHLYYGGAWVPPLGSGPIDLVGRA